MIIKTRKRDQHKKPSMTSESTLGGRGGIWGTLESGESNWHEQSYASETLLRLLCIRGVKAGEEPLRWKPFF